eukprot:SAG22_NODE_10930_length_509_cov_1.009756_2_plen_65_part_01
MDRKARAEALPPLARQPRSLPITSIIRVRGHSSMQGGRRAPSRPKRFHPQTLLAALTDHCWAVWA